MPRVSGVSASSTVWLRRRSPRPITVSSCVRLNPIVLFTSVILRRLPSAFFAFFVAIVLLTFALCPLTVLGPNQFRFFLAAEPRPLRRILQTHEAGKRRTHDVVRIRGAERLGQHVLNAAALHHGAHGTAGDESRAFRRRLEEHT